MAIIPLWRDISFQSQSSSLIFRVYDSADNLIYEGYAVEREAGDGVEVRLNDIFADDMQMRQLTLSANETTISESNKGYARFRVYADGSNAVYEVVADYSYQNMPEIPTAPIRLLLDRRQHFVLTSWDVSNTTNIYGMSSNGGYTRISYFNGPQTKSLPLTSASAYSGLQIKKTGFTTLIYDIKDTCADYVLHYVNAFGGWDSLVMLGRCAIKEDYTRHSVGRMYRDVASASTSRGNEVGKVIIANEVSKKWTLRTGLLTDDESSRMFHLLGTPRAILEDLNTGELFPVVISNSSYEEQTFRGNGNRMAQYEINVELAQQHIRR